MGWALYIFEKGMVLDGFHNIPAGFELEMEKVKASLCTYTSLPPVSSPSSSSSSPPFNSSAASGISMSARPSSKPTRSPAKSSAKSSAADSARPNCAHGRDVRMFDAIKYAGASSDDETAETRE